MAKAYLEVLDIKTRTRFSEYYYDDGFVDSVEAHEKRLEKIYGCSDEKTKNYKRKGTLVGKCVTILDLYTGTKHHHIFYLDTKNRLLNSFIRAHEETHALDFMKKLKPLKKKILKEQKTEINFKKISDKEIKAGIGELYFIFSQKLNPLFFRPNDLKFTIAKYIYFFSKFPKTNESEKGLQEAYEFSKTLEKSRLFENLKEYKELNYYLSNKLLGGLEIFLRGNKQTPLTDIIS